MYIGSFLPILLYVIPFLVFVAVLFFVVRGAVFSALRKHTAENRANPPTTPAESSDI